MAEWIKTSTIEVSLFDKLVLTFDTQSKTIFQCRGFIESRLQTVYRHPWDSYHRLFSLRVRPYVWVSFNCPFSRTAAFYTIGGSCLWKRLLKNPCTDSIVSCLDCITDSYVTALTMVCRSLCILWISVEILPNEFFCRSAFNVNCTSDFSGCHRSWIW